MSVCRNISVVLIVVITILTVGCSNFQALFRSVEKPIGKKQSDINDNILTEARAAYQSGNAAQAEELYTEYIEKNRRSSDKATLAFANAQLGRIAFKKSDFKASNRYFDQAVELDPDNLDTFGMYGESLYWQKDYIRAEALFKQAVQVAPNDTRFQLALGRTLAQQKQYLLGQRYLKQALGEQGAYEELARIYDEHREYEMAALATSKARESHTRQVAAASVRGVGIPASAPVGSFADANAGYAVTNSQVMQPNNSMLTSPSPGFMPVQPYQTPQQAMMPQQAMIPPQAMLPQNVPPQQAQMAARQPVILPQQPAIQQQLPMQQYQQQYPPQLYQAQQPVPQSVPQLQQPQPFMSANQGYPQPPSQYQNGVPVNPNPTTVQQGTYPAPGLPPQQASEPNPQWQPDNRPPYGFAATEQPLPANSQMAGMQNVPASQWQNGREIAYHPNYAATQPGMSRPNMSSPFLPLPGMNPSVENPAPTWQTPMWTP